MSLIVFVAMGAGSPPAEADRAEVPSCEAHADAVRRGPWLVITALRRSATVLASDRDFDVAARSAVPRSTVR